MVLECRINTSSKCRIQSAVEPVQSLISESLIEALLIECGHKLLLGEWLGTKLAELLLTKLLLTERLGTKRLLAKSLLAKRLLAERLLAKRLLAELIELLLAEIRLPESVEPRSDLGSVGLSVGVSVGFGVVIGVDEPRVGRLSVGSE